MNKQIQDYIERELIIDNFYVNDLFNLSGCYLIDTHGGCEANGYLVCPKDETDVDLINRYFDEVQNCPIDEDRKRIRKDQVGDVIFIEALTSGDLYNHGTLSQYVNNIILATKNFADERNIKLKLNV